MQRLVRVAKEYTAPVGAAFVNAHLAGFVGVFDAADRIMSLTFVDDVDPMRALAKRLRELRGKSNQTQRYVLTISALRAVHEGRGLKILREARGADVDVDHSQILLGVM
jgi:hypothetical protein